MDWDAEGLLDGVQGEDARDARRALLDELAGKGVGLDTLRRAAREDRLVLLGVERVLTDEPRYTAREVAEEVGVELAYLEANRRALGLPVPGADECAFSEQDLDTARIGRRYRDAGLPDEAALEVGRVLGEGMARYAEATRELVAQAFLEPGLDELELSHRFTAIAEQLMPLAGPWLEHVFALHLRQVLRRDVITEEQRLSGRVDGTQACTVAFADLVGFTELGESIGLEELGTVAGDLARLASREVRDPVRVVKQIGDAVMLVSSEEAAMVDTVLRLVACAADDDRFPALRAGVACGDAVNRWGDWFGTPVNLASRLTTRARPGSVLVTAAIREAAGEERFAYSDAGAKKLKGFASPVKAFRVRRTEEAAAS